MSENNEVFRSVEDVLATTSASIPQVTPDHVASRARLLAHADSLACRAVTTLDPSELEPAAGTAADAHADEILLDADEAGHKLDALCAIVVLAPTAGSALAVFAEHAAADPDGALVFACVLHLAGDAEGATFWWQLAAGAELTLAAYCLYLDHSRRGEYDDAALWARRLTDPSSLHALSDDSPLPPPRLRQVLPRSTRWTHRQEHEDLGPIPLASPRLAKHLFTLAPQPTQPAPGSWMVPAPVPSSRGTGAPPRAAEQCPVRHKETSPNAPSAPADEQVSESPGPMPAGRAFSALPLRHTTLAALAQQVPTAPHAPDQWAATMRMLDVLHAIRGARHPLATNQIASAARLDGVDLTRLMQWLCQHMLLRRLSDGSYTVGPLFSPTPAGDPVLRHDALKRLLDDLRDTTGAAIYLCRYTDGEVAVQHCSDSPTTPAITQWVDLKEAAHASANGKSLMAQLDFDSRMDHLDRHKPYALTDRTITDTAALFRVLDGHGPHASQFDVLEYSQREVCVAVPVALDGQPACIALSLPSNQLPRLIEAARTLSERSGLILLTLLATLPAGPEPAPEQGESADTTAGNTARTWNTSPAVATAGRSPSGLILPTGILAPGRHDWASFLTATQ